MSKKHKNDNKPPIISPTIRLRFMKNHKTNKWEPVDLQNVRKHNHNFKANDKL